MSADSVNKPESQKILERVYSLMRRMEQSYSQQFNESDLHQLSLLLQALNSEEDPTLQKLAQIQDHMTPFMSLRHFLNFLVPIERALGRSVQDSNFLIESKDRVPEKASPPSELIFICENMRSAFNIGSFFRLADCLNIQSIFLCGYSATPDQEVVKKTALGAEKSVHWQVFDDVFSAIQEAKKRGFKIISLETSPQAKNLFTFEFPLKTAFVVGNERFGLEAFCLKESDHVIAIPTFGIKNSLNVANALSIAAYEYRRQFYQVKS